MTFLVSVIICTTLLSRLLLDCDCNVSSNNSTKAQATDNEQTADIEHIGWIINITVLIVMFILAGIMMCLTWCYRDNIIIHKREPKQRRFKLSLNSGKRFSFGFGTIARRISTVSRVTPVKMRGLGGETYYNGRKKDSWDGGRDSLTGGPRDSWFEPPTAPGQGKMMEPRLSKIIDNVSEISSYDETENVMKCYEI